MHILIWENITISMRIKQSHKYHNKSVVKRPTKQEGLMARQSQQNSHANSSQQKSKSNSKTMTNSKAMSNCKNCGDKE